MYQHLPATEPIELHTLNNYLEADSFVANAVCIITSDLQSEEVLPALLKYIGESLELDRIIIYHLKKHSLCVEKQWLAQDGVLYPASDLLIAENNILGTEDKVLQSILQTNINKLDRDTSKIDIPIKFDKRIFGLVRFERISKKCPFTDKEQYILQRATSQIAIALKQEIYINQILSSNASSKENIANVSHELRTPLTSVIGFAKMLKKQIYGELNPKQLEYVTAIHNSGEYLLELINDLLDIAKIDAHKEQLETETILLKELCDEALYLVRGKAKEQGLELILNLKSDQEYCLGDRRRIVQILVNLLSNAVKFTEEGTITLEVITDKNGTNFSVIDTGIGIKEEDQQKLFEPFSQIVSPLHKKCQGTGLGLVLSRKLAQLHGGDISIESAEGKGSCFTLHLPKLSGE